MTMNVGYLGDLERLNCHDFYSPWVSGGLTAHELNGYLASLDGDRNPVTCLIQGRGTGKSRLLYETSLLAPTLYASLGSSSFGSFPPPSKSSSFILSLRDPAEVITALSLWVEQMSDQFYRGRRGGYWFKHQNSGLLKLDKEAVNDLPRTIRDLETGILRCTIDLPRNQVFLFLDEAQIILDDPELKLYQVICEGLAKFNRQAQFNCSVFCVLASSCVPHACAWNRLCASDSIVYALGAQGLPRVVHPSDETAHFSCTTASMRRFGRPCWRNSLTDDDLITLYTQRMALIRRMAGPTNFYRTLACLTTNVPYRASNKMARELIRFGWAQVMDIEPDGCNLSIAHPSEPFLACIALIYVRHNSELATMLDVLIADSRKRLWDCEDRHCLVARIGLLRAVCNNREWLVSLPEVFNSLWTSSRITLPTRIQEYKVNLNHFIRPDIIQVRKISLASFFQRCAGWIVPEQYYHFDLVVPLWTGERDECLTEGRMSAAFISVIDSPRAQKPAALFWNFFKAYQRVANINPSSLPPMMDLLDRVAKPAVFVVLDSSCREPTIVHMHPKHNSKQPITPSTSDETVLARFPSTGASSEADTRYPISSEPAASFNSANSENEEAPQGFRRCPSLSVSDWVVLHAPLYPDSPCSPIWMRAASLSMDPSLSPAIIPKDEGPQTTSLFYHRAMSTTPTSLLVDL